MEKNVRAIQLDGLLWGVSKFVDIGYGMKKLQINVVVEDDKVSVDDLQEKIQEDEDHVQATDVVSLLSFPRFLGMVHGSFTNTRLAGCHEQIVNSFIFAMRIFGSSHSFSLSLLLPYLRRDQYKFMYLMINDIQWISVAV